MVRLFRIDARDNVAIAFSQLDKGEIAVAGNGDGFGVLDQIGIGHKVALENIGTGQAVIKYGARIGITTRDILKGELVHSDNFRTGLSDRQDYAYQPVLSKPTRFFWKNKKPLNVFRRDNGKVGIRNELWIIPTVGCVNGVADSIIKAFLESCGDCSGVDGIYSFPHPYGCSQLGGDHERTRIILQNIALHPNTGGVLILGLGCENNQVHVFRETMPEVVDPERMRFLEAQTVEDEIAIGVDMLRQLYSKAAADVRVPGSWADIVLGLECGGSDAFSGITANPLIGRVSDYVVAHGGTTVLTEVPEMFGAEHILMQQCADRAVFEKTVDMINDYKNYYVNHNQPIYENPSPGNKLGGITTLEEKSLGCTRKAGNSPVVDVVKMEMQVKAKGLNLLYSPGNDIVATTALGATGCQLVLFSTGRGTPLGGFIPTMKIASNSALAKRKANWIDFNAGTIADTDADQDEILADFLDAIVAIINGKPTSAEVRNNREIAIFKTGVTL